MALVVLACAAAAYGTGRAARVEYTATAYVIYNPETLREAPAPTDSSVAPGDRYQGAALDVVAARTARRLPGAMDGTEVLGKVTTEYHVENSVLTIRATERRRRAAARLANAFAREYVEFWRASDIRRLHTALAIVEGRVKAMDAERRRTVAGRRARRRLARLRALVAHGPTWAVIGFLARVPKHPSSPSAASRAVAGAALGLLLGLALVALLERRLPRRAAPEGEDQPG